MPPLSMIFSNSRVAAGLSLLLWLCFSAPSMALTFVRDGKPVATIVVAERATKSARLAAFEFQYHVMKITGAVLPIVGDGRKSEGVSILIGESLATRERHLRSADFKPQEYLVRFEKNALILMGRDKEDLGKIDYAAGEGFPEPQDEQGTCYAVYDFLERHAGVRWYLPTELGLTFSPRSTFAAEGPEIRRSPAMRYRFLNSRYPYSEDFGGDTVQAKSYGRGLPQREQRLFYLRNRIGGQNHQVNHSFYGYYDRFWEKNPKKESAFETPHPAWFARGYEKVGKPPQMCYSNPEFIEQVVRDARDYFDGKGAKTGAVVGDDFALGPMDNDQWCQCPECQKQLSAKPTLGNGEFSNDRASHYVFSFVNKVARELRKTHPGARVSVLAYHDYAYPPREIALEPNVDVTLCLHTRNWPAFKETKANDLALVREWHERQKQVPLYLWLYYCWPSLAATQGQWRPFPGFFAHSIVTQMAYFHKIGVRGIFYEPSYVAGGRQSALLDQLAFHVTWSLANDPALDGDSLIADFFKRYYGPASVPMERFYNEVERIYGNPENYPAGVQKMDSEIAWKYLGTPERMQELGGLMEQARNAASSGSELEKRRVAVFDSGIWRFMQAGQASYQETAKIPSQTVSVPKINPSESAALPDFSRLDWQSGGILHHWRSIEGKAAETRLEGRLLHDGAFLYIRLQDPVPPSRLVDRGVIWNSDEYEFFFSKEQKRPVHQIGVDFKGRYSGLAYSEKGTGEWKAAFRVVSELREPDRWTLYLAIPLKELVEQGVTPGETFYMNVIRSMRIQPQQAFVWNAAFGDYHKPRYFGKVVLEP